MIAVYFVFGSGRYWCGYRLQDSSDKPLGATEACPSGAVRNISFFSNGTRNTPPAAGRDKAAPPSPGKAPRLHSPQREAARQGFCLYASGCGKEILFGRDVVQAGEVINGASESKRNLQDTL